MSVKLKNLENALDDDLLPASRTFPKTVRIRQILDAATTLMVRTGSHEVTIKAIATEADVSVGLIYKYFDNKLDLVQAVIVDVLHDISSRLDEVVASVDDPVRKVLAAFDAYCGIINERIDAVVLTYRETKTLNREGRDYIKKLEIRSTLPLRESIVSAIEAGFMRDVDPDLLAMDMLGSANNWALKNWFYRPRVTFEEYVAHQKSVFLGGLLEPAWRSSYESCI